MVERARAKTLFEISPHPTDAAFRATEGSRPTRRRIGPLCQRSSVLTCFPLVAKNTYQTRREVQAADCARMFNGAMKSEA